MTNQYMAQLEKAYTVYLAEVAFNNPFAPIVLRGGKNKPATTIELHDHTKLFQQLEKTTANPGWTIEWEEWSSKKFGRQQWPKNVSVLSETDLIFLLKKEREIETFRSIIKTLIEWRPDLRTWISQNVKDVLLLKEVWSSIIKVIDCLLVNDVREYYLRSVPVPVHTKFIKEHERIIVNLLQYLSPDKFSSQTSDIETVLQLRTKPFLFTARWLDAGCAKVFTNNMMVFGITTEDLHATNWMIERVILTENETSVYQLPELEGTLALCSNGKAVSLLKDIPLLAGDNLFYWGDMDEEGFFMLHHLRQLYPKAQSIMMDEATIALHEKEITTQPAKYKNMEMEGLLPHEYSAYKILAERNGRLEQEQLQHLYINKCLTELKPR
jgi:hypothetical protein